MDIILLLLLALPAVIAYLICWLYGGRYSPDSVYTAVVYRIKLIWYTRLGKSVVPGYKGFNQDMTCMGFPYREGGVYVHTLEPVLCRSGFHFCKKLTDVFRYYSHPCAVYCPVEAVGTVLEGTDDSKCCTDAIRVGRRLTPPEVLHILLEENRGLPGDHRIIEITCSGLARRSEMSRRLDLVLYWKCRAERYLEHLRRQAEASGDAPARKRKEAHHNRLKRVNGRLKRR